MINPRRAVILFALLLFGCADGRYLSKEQDQEMRALCEQQGGCTVVPTPMWKQIERAMGLGGA